MTVKKWKIEKKSLERQYTIAVFAENQINGFTQILYRFPYAFSAIIHRT